MSFFSPRTQWNVKYLSSGSNKRLSLFVRIEILDKCFSLDTVEEIIDSLVSTHTIGHNDSIIRT